MATATGQAPMSEAERSARLELAACYRICDMLGWSELIYNHISLRVPGEPDAFLINPFGLTYSEVTASNLVKIDIDGNRLSDGPWSVNLAGFLQHALFHRHLPDAHCIMHSHTTAGMAVSSVEGGLQPTNFYACAFYGRVAYHDFEGVTIRPEEGERLLANLGDKRVMFLRNHGLLVIGKTVPEVFFKHWSLQRACEIQLATATLGTPIMVPDAVVAVHQRDLSQVRMPGGPGRGDFDAMIRRIDKIDPGWRD